MQRTAAATTDGSQRATVETADRPLLQQAPQQSHLLLHLALNRQKRFFQLLVAQQERGLFTNRGRDEGGRRSDKRWRAHLLVQRNGVCIWLDAQFSAQDRNTALILA